MKDFIKDDITNMFEIIKLLLIGTDDNINVASLLIGLLRDKKAGSSLIYDIIYKNLSYSLQTRIKKAKIRIHTRSISQYGSEKCPYSIKKVQELKKYF